MIYLDCVISEQGMSWLKIPHFKYSVVVKIIHSGVKSFSSFIIRPIPQLESLTLLFRSVCKDQFTARLFLAYIA